MTDIQLMRDIKNNFHFFPNQNHSSKYTDIETVFKKKVSESSVTISNNTNYRLPNCHFMLYTKFEKM